MNHHVSSKTFETRFFMALLLAVALATELMLSLSESIDVSALEAHPLLLRLLQFLAAG